MKSMLIKTNCPRCGKAVMTVRRSMFGAEATRKKFGGICGDCLTPAEQSELGEGLHQAIVTNIRNGGGR